MDETQTQDQNDAQDIKTLVFAAIDRGDNHEQLVNQFHMTLDQARAVSIKRHYECGRGSIQDYSRLYGIDVSLILQILDQPEMDFVQTIGDLIDQSEAGAEAKVNEEGKRFEIPWDTK